MGYLPYAKLGAQLVTGLGVSKIVGDIVRNNVAVVTPVQVVTVYTATFVLASMAVDATGKHVVDQIDNLVQWIEDRKVT